MAKIACIYPNCGRLILPDQYEIHINFCRQKIRNLNLKRCEYNALHILPQVEMAEHLNTCLDKRNVENFFARQVAAETHQVGRAGQIAPNEIVVDRIKNLPEIKTIIDCYTPPP